MPLKHTIPRQITVILLAAGASTRMKGADKLLEKIDNIALLSRVVQTCLASGANNFIAITQKQNSARDTLIPPPFQIYHNTHWAEGMASSLRVGIKNLAASCDAILVVLADMPDIRAADLNSLIAGFDPENGITICRATSENGTPGHPVLFGRDHFDALARLCGDQGAKEVLRANPDAIKYIKTKGLSAIVDLDTPEDWIAYRGR